MLKGILRSLRQKTCRGLGVPLLLAFFLDVFFDPFEKNLGDLIAVLVPHHDVIVAPDSCLGNSVEQRRARKLGQRKVDGVSTCRVDLAVCVKARPGAGRPT